MVSFLSFFYPIDYMRAYGFVGGAPHKYADVPRVHPSGGGVVGTHGGALDAPDAAFTAHVLHQAGLLESHEALLEKHKEKERGSDL